MEYVIFIRLEVKHNFIFKDETLLLKHKLYASLIMATLLPLTISTLLFSNNIRENSVQRLENTELPTALSNVKNAIEWQLAAPIATSRAIAKNLFIEQWIESGEPENSTDNFIEYLDHIKNNDDAITAYIVSDKTKKYYSSSSEIRNLIFPSDNWFNDFLYSNKPYELSFDINKEINKAKIYINYAIEVNGLKVGIAGISHSLNSMNDMIENQTIGQSGIVYLVDQNGLIKLHPNQELIGSVVSLNNIMYGHQSTRLKGQEEYIVSSIPLTSLNWHLVAEIPSQELYGPIDSAIKTNLLWGTLIALVGLIFIMLFVNRMFKPIEDITVSISSLATKIIGKR